MKSGNKIWIQAVGILGNIWGIYECKTLPPLNGHELPWMRRKSRSWSLQCEFDISQPSQLCLGNTYQTQEMQKPRKQDHNNATSTGSVSTSRYSNKCTSIQHSPKDYLPLSEECLAKVAILPKAWQDSRQMQKCCLSRASSSSKGNTPMMKWAPEAWLW